MPASGRSMNYVSALYIALAAAMILDWRVRARWEFRGHLKRKFDVAAGEGGVRDVAMVTDISDAAGRASSGGGLMGERGGGHGGDGIVGVGDNSRKGE